MSKKQSDFKIIIDSNRIEKEYLKDLFHFRELIYFFAWRDILVRYKQTALGIAWAIIRPLLYMAVFVLVFAKIARLDTHPISYPLFVLSGMLPWSFFSNCLADSGMSLIQNSPLLTKVYFPRMILPFTSIIVNFIDFFISLLMLFIVMYFMGSFDVLTLCFLPLFLLLTLALNVGMSLWSAALTVRFRDLRFLVPFITQFGMFVSPVGYSSDLVPELWKWLYFLNPMAGIIEGVRWSCFGVYHSYLPLAVSLSIFMTVLILTSGFCYFRKLEKIFADII